MQAALYRLGKHIGDEFANVDQFEMAAEAYSEVMKAKYEKYILNQIDVSIHHLCVLFDYLASTKNWRQFPHGFTIQQVKMID